MENKVSLYDSNDNKIGDTFARRARQLVNQQRAMWTDDSQTAVRFAPGMENMDIAATNENNTEANLADDTKLNDLVERRMREREKFVLRTAALFPGIFLLMLLSFTVPSIIEEVVFYNTRYYGYGFINLGDFIAYFFAFICFAWIAKYIGYAYIYFSGKKARKRMKKVFSAEIAALKNN